MFLLISKTANTGDKVELNFVRAVPEILPESLILLAKELSPTEQELVRACEGTDKLEALKGVLLRTYLANSEPQATH